MAMSLQGWRGERHRAGRLSAWHLVILSLALPPTTCNCCPAKRTVSAFHRRERLVPALPRGRGGRAAEPEKLSLRVGLVLTDDALAVAAQGGTE